MNLKNLKINQNWAVILLASIVTIITFGVLIFELGYYQDDWYLIWAGQTGGLSDVIGLFSTDRPFMGWVYAVDYKFLGDGILGWHLYALFLKLVGVWGVYWLMKLMWPKEKFLQFATLMIFVVYPGFLSQPIANTFQNHLLTYGAALWSIAFSVAAIKYDNKWLKGGFLVVAVALTALYEPIYEYMIGLEGVRFVLLWLALQEKYGRNWKSLALKTGLWYLPHFLVSITFTYWRFFIFESTRATTDEAVLLAGYQTNPVSAILRLLIEVIKDILDSVLHVWSYSLYTYFDQADFAEFGEAVFWALLVVALVWIYLFLVRNTDTDDEGEFSSQNFVWLGLWMVFITLVPMVFAGRNVRFGGFERYTLQTSLGVALLLAGILQYVRPRMREYLLLSLIFIGVSTHVINARKWADLWQTHKDIWWQIAWRVPAFEDDTLLLVSGFNIEQDYEAWVPLNMIYAPDEIAPTLDVELLYSGSIIDTQLGNVVGDAMRHIPFEKDYREVLVVTRPSDSSCVHFIDQNLPVVSAWDKASINQVTAYSDINHILAGDEFPTPPDLIFGSEPDKNWCYYYQKISYARQFYDWDQIVVLADEAANQGFEPQDPTEWLPVVEGYLMTGDYAMAKSIGKNIQKENDIRISLCFAIDANATALAEIAGYDRAGMIDVICTQGGD